MSLRAEFEAYAVKRGTRNFSRDERGCYCVDTVNAAWEGYQAAHSAAIEACAAACEPYVCYASSTKHQPNAILAAIRALKDTEQG